MKLLSDTEFVELARSDDANRIVLCGILNTGRHLVGTNTHVLHVVEYDQPTKNVSEWTFTPGSNDKTKRMKEALANFEPFNLERYPNWERVVPEFWDSEGDYEKITFGSSDAVVEFLQLFYKLAATCNEGSAMNRVTITTNAEEGTVLFEFKPYLMPVVRFSMDAEVTRDMKFAVNLRYLVDAIQGVTTEQFGQVEVRLTRKYKDYSGYVTEHKLNGYNRPIVVTQVPLPFRKQSRKRFAIVMPCECR